MYRDAAPGLGPTDDGDGNDVRRRLWAEVRFAFPDLPGSRFRLEQRGGDHLVLIVDEKRAFRFPRPGRHGLALEVSVLRWLGPRAAVAVPVYDIVDPGGRFAGYPLIAGRSLTRARYAALSAGLGRSAIADAVALLNVLHSLDPPIVSPEHAWPLAWSATHFADRLEHHQAPTLAGRVPALTARITSFLRKYRADRPAVDVVLHGDFVGDHLLIDEAAGCLCGIIDFSDVALGDPAQDFLGFWAYGPAAARHAVSSYARGDADQGLLTRSRNHFIRYRIDRLYEMIVDGASVGSVERHAATLARLMADLDD